MVPPTASAFYILFVVLMMLCGAASCCPAAIHTYCCAVYAAATGTAVTAVRSLQPYRVPYEWMRDSYSSSTTTAVVVIGGNDLNTCSSPMNTRSQYGKHRGKQTSQRNNSKPNTLVVWWMRTGQPDANAHLRCFVLAVQSYCLVYTAAQGFDVGFCIWVGLSSWAPKPWAVEHCFWHCGRFDPTGDVY